ncbi:DOMON-like domain-containing protein [Novosphingobium piscinae]|uniref:DOMON-like domain-containing protein n=1 Tax=Novosphingobium piscinae TaxID=1507448 RepID=UPI0031B5F2B2
MTLHPHPDHAPARVRAIEAAVIGLDDHWLQVRWRIEGAGAVLVPAFAGKARADGLWQQTCFELFVRTPGEEGYVELNLSPSERWAAYDFAAYRAGMADRPMPRDPVGTIRGAHELMIFDAAVPLAGLPALPWQLGISAVIEEEGGARSFWALRHGPGAPDFHAPACFAARLEAPATG